MKIEREPTRIIPRLRHSYYICSHCAELWVSRDSIGYAAMQIHLSATTVSFHMEYRAILLSTSYTRYFPFTPCRIACDTRIYSTAMRRLPGLSRNAPFPTRHATRGRFSDACKRWIKVKVVLSER